MQAEWMSVTCVKGNPYPEVPFFCSPTREDRAVPIISCDHVEEANALWDGRTEWKEKSLRLSWRLGGVGPGSV